MGATTRGADHGTGASAASHGAAPLVLDIDDLFPLDTPLRRELVACVALMRAETQPDSPAGSDATPKAVADAPTRGRARRTSPRPTG